MHVDHLAARRERVQQRADAVALGQVDVEHAAAVTRGDPRRRERGEFVWPNRRRQRHPHPPRHPRSRPDGRQRPAHHFAPAVQQQHAIRDRLDQVHVVRAQDHGGACIAQLPDQAAHEVLVHGIEAAEGLVQDRQGRLVQQRGDELHLLLVPFRQRVDAVTLAAGEIEVLQPRARLGLCLGRRHPPKACQVDDHRQDLCVGVEAAVLR